MRFAGQQISRVLACATIAVLLSANAIGANPSTINMYNLGGSPERNALMASLSGLVARTTADVAMGYQFGNFLSNPTFWVDQYIADNPGTSKVWQSNAEWFMGNYRDHYNGYVVYDANSINEATSVAGALGAIMVNENLLTGTIGTVLSALEVPQLEDVRGRDSTWVYNNYGSHFNKDKIFRQQPQFPYQLRSLAVKEAGFVFNDTGPTRDNFLAGQNPHSLVYGWGYNNDEYEFFSSASQNNLMAVPTDHLRGAAPHSAWNVDVPGQATHAAPDTPTEAGKHYVAFVLSDGDNVQWLANDFRDPRWFGSPHRGNFDFTFDISPDLINVNPTALKYFYDQAAGDEHRSFFVTPGGQGINYPSQVPDIQGFMDATVESMLAVDHNVISVLDDTPNLASLEQMVERPEVLGLMLKTGAAYAAQNGAIHWHNGKPIVSVKYTLWDGFDTPNSIISALNGAPTDPYNDQGSYTIVNVHPWSTSLAGGGLGDPMSNVNYIVENLDPSVRVVALDELIIHLRNNFGEPVSHGTRRNLVANGGFEILDPNNPSRPANWFYGAGTSLVQGEDSTGTGQYAAAISEANSDWRSVDFDVSAGELLSFSFDFKFDGDVPDGSGFRADARFFSESETEGGTFLGETVAFLDAANHTADEWHSLMLSVVVPEGATAGDVRFSTYFGPFEGGQVLIDNVELLVAVTPGDFNADGVVDGQDLEVWEAAFGNSDAADADGDGHSDGSDFLVWQRNYQPATTLVSQQQAVPEPGAFISSLIGLMCLSAFRRRGFSNR